MKIRKMAKNLRKLGILPTVLLDKHAILPLRAKKSWVSTSGTSFIHPVGDFEKATNMVQSLPLPIDIQVKQAMDPKSDRHGIYESIIQVQ